MIAEMQEQRISHTGHTGVNSNDGRFEHANANDHMLHNPNQESDPNKGTLLFPPPPRSVFEGKPNNNLIQCLSLFSPTALRACVCVCVCVCMCFLCVFPVFPCVWVPLCVSSCVLHGMLSVYCTMLRESPSLLFAVDNAVSVVSYPINPSTNKKPISPYLTCFLFFHQLSPTPTPCRVPKIVMNIPIQT
jgi:hypothetical protein